MYGCMRRYLMENLSWLADQINDYGDDYLVFDCPGQIELYTHLPVMKNLLNWLQRNCNYQLCAVYMIDSLFVTDASRFISGTLMCLSAMVQLELPHVNILSKCDLIQDKKLLEKFIDPDCETILSELNAETNPHYSHLNRAISTLLEQFSMVSFIPLDFKEDESLELVLAHIDTAMQYGEDLEPKEPNDEKEIDALETIQE